MLEDCKEGGWGWYATNQKQYILVETGHHNGEGPKGHVRYRRVGMGKDHGAAGKRDQYKDASRGYKDA